MSTQEKFRVRPVISVRPTVSVRSAVSVLAWLATALFLAVPTPSHAFEYEVFIDVQDEEDLYTLFEEQQIEDDTFEILLELIRAGVHLNYATREELYALPNLTYDEVIAILKYRDEVGQIKDPAELVAADVLSSEKLLALTAFLIVDEVDESGAYATTGNLRYRTSWLAGEDTLPSMALQSRITSFRHLTVGVTGVVSRYRPGTPTYESARDRLYADPITTRLHVPKFFVAWETKNYGLIAGTYRIGFAQKLTFDTTNLPTPDGFQVDDLLRRSIKLTRACKQSTGDLAATPCPTGIDPDTLEPADIEYASPDWRWTDGLRGVAASLKSAQFGPGHFSAHGFTSWQTLGQYQYELYDRRQCSDPHSEDDSCKSPPVYVPPAGDLLDPAATHAYQALPNLYDQLLGGANLSYNFSARDHIGVTGWYSQINWLTEGVELDFQEWSRLPYGGPFGAVGVDGSFGVGNTDIFAEVSRSIDSIPTDQDGGGGYAGIVRSVSTWQNSELEAIARYYDTQFNNPFARPPSQPDEYDGLRARDEAGGRLRYTTSIIDDLLDSRTWVDVWITPSNDIKHIFVYTRGDLTLSKQWRLGLWADWYDKDLERSGRGQCFQGESSSTSEVDVAESGPLPCGGDRYRANGQLHFQPDPKWNFTARYQHTWVDAQQYPDSMRQDSSAWAIAALQPLPGLSLRLRTRYLFQDIHDNTRFEQSLRTTAMATYAVARAYRLQLRYDLINWLDDRQSTLQRVPSPAHWFWLDAKFQF